ncbi:MAG: bifunctional aspartate kinase/diaminopimelate decarboxylase, partial [Pseudomonadota bacterium]
ASAQAPEAIGALRAQHLTLAKALGLSDCSWLEAGIAQLESALVLPAGPQRTAAVLAQGEWLSSHLGEAFLAQGEHPACWVDARDALTALPEPNPESRRAWLSARCEAGAEPALAERWAARGPVLITQGYVARSPNGGTALLGRSGSDTSAALLATRLDAEAVEIWTDVPGLFTADPRIEPNARLVDALSFEEALEMAASGARVIHGRCIRAAAAARIPLLIRTLAAPEAPGTRISDDAPTERTTARAVVSQPDMLVLLLQNLDTRQQVGFLAGVFEVISRAGLSVEQVATSETTTTLAIDTVVNHLDADGVDELVSALEPLCTVEAFNHCVCVSLVGRDARLALHGLAATQAFFRRHRLLMMSHSAADRSVSLLVDRAGADELARILHAELVVRDQVSDSTVVPVAALGDD